MLERLPAALAQGRQGQRQWSMADRRFYNALRDHLAPTYLLWVADVPAAEG